MDFGGDVGRELNQAKRKLLRCGFERHVVQVEVGEHVYRMGLQHRKQADGEHWRPTKVSHVYVFANDAGAASYCRAGRVDDAFLEAVKHQFDY